jgi:hypothetical protein
MQATLHLPGATPRLLTADELAALNPNLAFEQLTIDFEDGTVAVALRELLGTAIHGEVLAAGPAYLVVSVENAADYGFNPTPSATADIERLIGMELDEDDPLVGPLLIIEA